MKLSSDSGIGDFLKKKKPLGVLLAAIAGAVLIFLSGRGGERASETGTKTELYELCSAVEGVGRCETVVNYSQEGDVYSVAVLCEGADDIEVRSALFGLISRFYGIGYNRISVLKISQ